MRADKQMAVVDGQVRLEYPSISEISFSPDGKRMAYIVSKQDKWFVVMNGVEGPEFDGILQHTARFSPDSKRFVYAGRKGEKVCIVLDSKVGPELEGIYSNTLQFSPDSKHLVYSAKINGQRTLMLDGVAEPN